MTNIKGIINKHHQKILRAIEIVWIKKERNRKTPANHLLNRKCETNSVIYQAEVTSTNNSKETHMDLTEG